MPGGHGGDVNRCGGDRADEQDETEPERGERDVCARGADRVAYHANSRADVDPAEHRVERPPDLLVERHVEDLDENEQAEQDSSDGGHDPSRPGRQHHRDSDQDQPLHRYAGKGGRGELEETVGRDENTPHEHDRKHGDGQPQSPATAQSMRAPSGVTVPVRRATCRSAASRTSATVDRVTSAVIDTGRPNESATSPATPAISTGRVRVTQSAGCIAGWSLRMRALTSSAVAAEPVASPTIQPATPRPDVAATAPSSAAVASNPRIVASRTVRSAPL